MKPKFLTILIAIFMIFLLSACGAPAEPTIDVPLAHTQAAQTVEAVLTEQVQPTMTPPEPSATQAEVVQPEPTATNPPPTDTPMPTEPPTTTPTEGLCENRATFIDDITIPDNTVLLPGESFTKTWRLENTGTCTWKTSYALFFVQGDLMGALSPTTLSSEVKSGEQADLSVQFKAPGTPGTYRSDWTLLDTKGVKIGLNDKPDATFWVQIVVQEGTASLNLGTPTWKDNMDNSDYWYMVSTDNTEWEFKDGYLRMKAKDTGEPEEWGLSSKAAMQDYYLQATFKTGTDCDGLDRYGVLARAPEQNQGYVFEFSCDGRYRLYKWDGKSYSALQEWKSSSFIQAGANQSNVLGIWMEDDTIRLYANGKLLAEFEDSKFDEGRFGLVVGASETENFTALVDEVAYWKIGE